MRPWLDGALGKASGRVGDDQRLVVAEDVAEALALRAGAQGVVEGEEHGLRPRQADVAARAAELAAHAHGAVPHHLDGGPAVALDERHLERFREPPATLGREDHAVEYD